jgi:hypothetical protein
VFNVENCLDSFQKAKKQFESKGYYEESHTPVILLARQREREGEREKKRQRGGEIEIERDRY